MRENGESTNVGIPPILKIMNSPLLLPLSRGPLATVYFSLCTVLALTFSACQEKPENSADTTTTPKPATEVKESTPAENAASQTTPATDGKVKTEVATFGGGCFWCTEAVMERLEGVTDVVSGYMGGHVKNPTYEQICEKNTGHVEVIQVSYDPAKIDFNDLLDVFWQAHDPTTWDQQGADKGPQYRSVIFTHSPEQKTKAEQSKKLLNESGTLTGPVVTEIRDADTFWEAEEYHQDFYKNNPNYGYCRVVISPKLKKLGLD